MHRITKVLIILALCLTMVTPAQAQVNTSLNPTNPYNSLATDDDTSDDVHISNRTGIIVSAVLILIPAGFAGVVIVTGRINKRRLQLTNNQR